MLVIGVDVGGTFTDVVVFDEDTGEVKISKVNSTPPDFTEGVMQGILQTKINLGQVRRLVHGTTIATNAIVERRGAKTALITTQGFKDVIEIGDNRRFTGGQYDPRWVRISPLVPRHLRLEVPERILHDGRVRTKLRDEDIVDLAEKLKVQQVESVAVCFLHAYVNRSHERQAGQLLQRCLPEVAVSLSAETVPEYREFERFSTTVLNAYIAPLLKKYLERLGNDLRRAGYRGELFFMVSNGGVVTEETAAAYPIRFVLSGPAGGVSAGTFIGERLGLRNIITCDMGGTSTDVCLVRDFRPGLSVSKTLLAFPIKTPQLDINTIGAGGGSVAWVDPDGSLHVGPQSTGAVPGPASYGLGGTDFTVTDANLLLGRIGPATLLGGTLKLSKELAAKAIQPIAQRLKMPDIYQLAEGVIKIAVTNMSHAIREVSVEQGHDPRDATLMAGGGAGPMHAIPVAVELGIKKILVPAYPGHMSAFGLVTSDLKHDYVRTYVVELRKADLSRIRGLLKEMADEGLQVLIREALSRDRIDLLYSLDLRYLGQSWVLNTPIAPDFEISHMERAFHQQYEKTYGYCREEKDVELVNLRVVASGRVDKPVLHTSGPKPRPLSEATKEKRKVRFEGGFVDCVVYQRELLPWGITMDGPAILEEFGATTVVFPGWNASVDRFGNLVLTRKGGDF